MLGVVQHLRRERLAARLSGPRSETLDDVRHR